MKYILITLLISFTVYLLIAKPAQAATDNVTYTANQLATLSINITAGDSFDFGDLTFGVSVPAPAGGTIVSIETNAANGYTLGVSDGSGINSGLINVADGTTAVPDMTNGTVGTPVVWGANTGLGITMWDADTTPEGKWCAGVCTSYDDADNKYAAVPAGATTAHTVTGIVVGADTSSWAYEVETTAGQKTGAYSGIMTFTATAVIS